MKKYTLNLRRACPFFLKNYFSDPLLNLKNTFSGSHKLLGLFVILGFGSATTHAQTDIFKLMEREDLKIQEIESLAGSYFETHGTQRGSGYKQYQRWLHEQKFHLNADGSFIPPSVENEAYQKFISEQKQYKSASNPWKELGPNSWSRTTGWNPGLGRITTIAIHPDDTTVIYVGTPGGGLWKSVNSGLTWVPLTDNYFHTWMHISTICIDPTDRNTVYVGLAQGGVIKSTNGGATFANTTSGPSNPKKVIAVPGNPNVLFAAGANGITRSINGGTSWTNVLSGFAMEDIEYNPGNPNLMYASAPGTNGSVWRSVNGGLNWTLLGTANGITATGRTLLAVSPKNPAVVYAVQANGTAFGKLYRSSDSGATYTTMVTGNPASGTNYFGYEIDGKGSGGQATYDMAVCVNPKNENEIHIAGIICWKSVNGGASFVPETDWYLPNPIGYNHADVHVLEWVKSTIYSGSDGGIYKSVNRGDDWVDISKGLAIRQVYRLSTSKTNANVIVVGAQDNGTTVRQSTGQWKDWLGADGMDNLISPTNHLQLFGTNQNGYLFRSSDGGNTYKDLKRPASGNWITPLAMHPNSHDTIYGGYSGIWQSNNGGVNWIKISGTYITGLMNCLAVAPTNAKYIYGTVNNILHRTDNGGQTWSSVTLPVNITSICVSPVNPEKIWLTFNSTTIRVYVSEDMGNNFTDISSGLPNMSARSVVVDDNQAEGVYVGMNIGVCYMDKNTPWMALGTGLPLVAINDIKIQKSSAKVRIATYGRGVWETDLIHQDACNPPTGLSATAITSNSATVSWTAAYGAKSYDVEYKEEDATNWSNSINVSGTSCSISGLTSGKTYDWRVKTNCTYYGSTYAESKITTECPLPQDLMVNNVVYDGADLGWKPVPGALSYTVAYKLPAETTWTGTQTTEIPVVNFTGLNAGTKYDWQVSAQCANNSSNFISSNFITLCVEPSNAHSDNISSNGVRLSWDNVSGASDYTFEYKASNAGSWNAITAKQNKVDLSGLSTGLYDWRVTTNCKEGSQGFLNSEFLVYCISSGTITTYEFIRHIGLNTLQRNSRSDNGLFQESNPSAVLIPGETYELTYASAMPVSDKQGRQHYWRFFLDYNRNGYVYDANELIGWAFTTDTSIRTVRFTVPADAAIGKTMLRTSLKFGSYQNPCNPIKYGEVEDYYVEITNTPRFAAPRKFGAGIAELMVYPIPARNAFNLSYTLGEPTKNLNIILSDVTGKIFYQTSADKNKGAHTEVVNCANLNTGIYFLTLKSERSMVVQKVIIKD